MLELALSGEDDWPGTCDWDDLARRAALAALAETTFASLLAMVSPVEISILLSDDAHVRQLNNDYRGKDRPTNVLSFPMLDADELGGLTDSGDVPVLLGDIVLALGTCVREAGERAVPIAHHAAHLIVHGALHLLGYDHMKDDEADAMEAMEARALARLDIADPYDGLNRGILDDHG